MFLSAAQANNGQTPQERHRILPIINPVVKVCRKMVFDFLSCGRSQGHDQVSLSVNTATPRQGIGKGHGTRCGHKAADAGSARSHGLRPRADPYSRFWSLTVDGYDGFKRLASGRADSSVKLAFCWAHMRRPFYECGVSTKSPLAAAVLAKISELYAIEAEIRGHPAEHRRRIRQERSRPIVDALHVWLQDHLGRVSAVSDLAKAIRYAIRHWPGLVVFLEDGRVEMDMNVVERAIRPNTLTRKNALFAGNDGGARH
jgi:hypothetical protein